MIREFLALMIMRIYNKVYFVKFRQITLKFIKPIYVTAKTSLLFFTIVSLDNPDSNITAALLISHLGIQLITFLIPRWLLSLSQQTLFLLLNQATARAECRS